MEYTVSLRIADSASVAELLHADFELLAVPLNC